jgi:hypothetical protein
MLPPQSPTAVIVKDLRVLLSDQNPMFIHPSRYRI